MTENARTSATAIQVFLAILVPGAGYLLSFGPACWIAVRSGRTIVSAYHWFYAPILWIYHNGPQTARDAIFWYGNLGI